MGESSAHAKARTAIAEIAVRAFVTLFLKSKLKNKLTDLYLCLFFI